MTSLTALYALPYPDDTDLVTQGDDAIQALAEALEAHLAPAWVHRRHSEGSVQNAAAAGVDVAFPDGSPSASEHFTNDGNAFVYGGGYRPFVVSATLSFQVAAAGAVSASFLVNGSVMRKAVFQDQAAVGGSGPQIVTLPLSWSGFLGPGDRLVVAAFGPDGTPIQHPAFSAHSIGPVHA